MQKLLMTNHQLTDKMNNWCEINYDVNLTETVKQGKLILWGKSWPHDSCLMQDFICIETEWTSLHTLLQTHACIPAGSGCWESTHHCVIKRNLEKMQKSLSVAMWYPEVRESSFIRLFLCCLSEAVQLVWEHIQSSPVSWDGGGEEINSCVEEWTCV